MSDAQPLLDQLNEINIPFLFVNGVSPKERGLNLKIARQKMKLIKQSIREKQTEIKARWDGRDKYQAEREKVELLPYQMLDKLIGEIEVSFSELDAALKLDKPIPTNAPAIDELIVEETSGNRYTCRLMSRAQHQQMIEERALEAEALRQQEAVLRQRREKETKSKLRAAHTHIKDKDYAAARAILEGIPYNDMARQWLSKLDAIDQRRKDRQKNLLRVVLIGLTLFVVAVALWFIRPVPRPTASLIPPTNDDPRSTLPASWTPEDAAANMSRPTRTLDYNVRPTNVPNNSSDSDSSFTCPSNCDGARALGLSAGEAAACGLDRDNDGVACYGD